MRTLIVLAALLAVACAAPLLTQSFVNEINSKQSLWTAGVVPKFAGLSKEELSAYCSVRIPESKESKIPKVNYAGLREFMDLPDSFDTRTKWPTCKMAVRDQGQCGSCWAFGAVEAFEDRLCQVSGGAKNVFLSTQSLVDCDTTDYGCSGGWPVNAWEYIQANGIPTESCYPYQAYDQPCKSSCADGSTWTTFHAKNVRTYTSTDDVKTDIMTNGAVETWFAVYDDFFSYTDGIYTPTSTSLAGYHAIEVIGWGKQDGTEFWVAANSWGTSWGMKGYFNIEAGTCQFDEVDHFVSGDPQA